MKSDYMMFKDKVKIIAMEVVNYDGKKTVNEAGGNQRIKKTASGDNKSLEAAVESRGKLVRCVFGVHQELSKMLRVDGSPFIEGSLDLAYKSPLAPWRLFGRESIDFSFAGPIREITTMSLEDYILLERAVIGLEAIKGIHECSELYGELKAKVTQNHPEVEGFLQRLWQETQNGLGRTSDEHPGDKKDREVVRMLAQSMIKKSVYNSTALYALFRSLTREGIFEGYKRFWNALNRCGSQLAREEYRAEITEAEEQGQELDGVTRAWQVTSSLGNLYTEIANELMGQAVERHGDPNFLMKVVKEEEMKSYGKTYWEFKH